MGYVNGTEDEPAKSTKLADWKKWNTSSLKAMSIILDSVEMRLHPYLINCTTPKEVGDKLQQRFGDASEDAKQSAWHQFYDIRINDGEYVSQRLEDFECICRQLIDSGDKPSDSAVQSKLLKSLPPRFSPFLMAWESTPKTERKKDTLINRIIYEDKRLCDAEDKLSSLALQIHGYTDGDYAGCLKARRSRSGFVFLLNGGPISWSSQRQSIVSLSTAEAEYIALTHGTKEAIWLRQMLKELDISCNSIPISVDNQSAIK